MSNGMIIIPDDKLEILLERAADKGAAQALSRIGLHDEDATKDVLELRQLIVDWRSIKSQVIKTVGKAIGVGILALLGISFIGDKWKFWQ